MDVQGHSMIAWKNESSAVQKGLLFRVRRTAPAHGCGRTPPSPEGTSDSYHAHRRARDFMSQRLVWSGGHVLDSFRRRGALSACG